MGSYTPNTACKVSVINSIMIRILFVSFLATFYAVQSLPQRPTDCGQERQTGLQRQNGDIWSPDGCNNCKCLQGRAACTRKFCLIQGEGTCLEGRSWQEKSGEEIRKCDCLEGSPVCSKKEAQTLPSSISFPSEKVDARSAGFCKDSQGREQTVGEEWKEECNTCRCAGGRT